MVGIASSSSRSTTISNADPAVCSSGAPLARSAIDPRSIAGAEGAAGAGEHQHPDGGIGLDPVEQRHQRVEVIGLQPVQMLRPVEADGGARAADFQDRRARRFGGFRHGGLHYLLYLACRGGGEGVNAARADRRGH